MNFKVAIPSHARAERLNETTLPLLANRGVPKHCVNVFVGPGEVPDYTRTLDPGLYGGILEGPIGLGPQRNNICASYPNGTPLVQMDDDIVDLRRKVDDKKHVPVEDVDAFFGWAFSVCVQNNVSMWGIYPVLNAMFMGTKVRTGLVYCIGQVWGCFNDQDPALRIVHSQKEDYERVLRQCDKHDAVVRMDMVAAKTRMYAPGGMQADDQPDRRAINEKAVDYLLERWPDRVRVKAKENPKCGREIRLVEA